MACPIVDLMGHDESRVWVEKHVHRLPSEWAEVPEGRGRESAGARVSRQTHLSNNSWQTQIISFGHNGSQSPQLFSTASLDERIRTDDVFGKARPVMDHRYGRLKRTCSILVIYYGHPMANAFVAFIAKGPASQYFEVLTDAGATVWRLNTLAFSKVDPKSLGWTACQ